MNSEVSRVQEKVVDEKEHDLGLRNWQSPSLRAVLIAVTVLTFLAFTNPGAELYGARPVVDIGFSVPSPAAIFVVLFLVCLNLILRRVRRTWVFVKSELFAVYGLIFAGGVVLQGFFSYWVFTIMQFTRYHFIEGDRSVSHLYESASSLIMPKSYDAAMGFWLGEATVPWSEWIVPIMLWSIFVTVLFFTMVCVVSLVRKHWTEREHLQYPLMQPIIRMTGDGSQGALPFWKDRIMWIGFAIPAVILSLNHLHGYLPVLPTITLHWDAFSWFPSDSFMGSVTRRYPPFRMNLSPMIIGIGYLVPTSLSFSVWFFYLLQRLVILSIKEVVLGPATILTQIDEVSQNVGAFVGIAAIALWFAREDIIKAFRGSVLKHESSYGSKDDIEALPYQTAVYGLVLGIVFLAIFSMVFMRATILGALAYFIVFIGLVLALARLRAELGLPMQNPVSQNFTYAIAAPLGKDIVGKTNIWFYAMVYPFSYGVFGSLGAITAEQLKLCDDARINRRSMMFWLIGIVAFASVFSFVGGLPTIYEQGAYRASGHYWSAQTSRHIFRIEEKLQWFGTANPLNFIYSLGLGLGGTLALSYFHVNYVWWPFHPVGWALATYHNTFIVWAPMLVAWSIKVLANRWGGGKLIKLLYPFFLGLIAGQIITDVFWSILASVLSFF